MSQLDLATQAEVSPRHLSFVETGRSRPSRELVLHLAEHLDVPLRDRNELLTAAGFAPLYRQSALDDPTLASVRTAIAVILANHSPLPAFVIDGGWQLVDANDAIADFLPLIDPALTEPPHERDPRQPAPRRPLSLDRELRRVRRARRRAPPSPARCHVRPVARARSSTRSAPTPHVADALAGAPTAGPLAAVLPMHFRLADGTELRYFSTMTVFGSPLDVTIAELAIESFFPADEATAEFYRA